MRECDWADILIEQLLSSLEKEFSPPRLSDGHLKCEGRHRVVLDEHISSRDEIERVMDLYLKPAHKQSKGRMVGLSREQLYNQTERLGLDSEDHLRLELTLDMRSCEIPNVLEFNEDISADISRALRLNRRQVLVDAVRSGSVIVDITIKRLRRSPFEVRNSVT